MQQALLHLTLVTIATLCQPHVVGNTSCHGWRGVPIGAGGGAGCISDLAGPLHASDGCWQLAACLGMYTCGVAERLQGEDRAVLRARKARKRCTTCSGLLLGIQKQDMPTTGLL